MGVFFVSNHVGYADGLVLGALFPVTYVSKSELKKWPLIGLMAEVSGTLFIDRLNKSRLSEYIGKMSAILKQGVNILFFPEGTSTNGEELLPFKTAFFQAPLGVCAPIVPVSIVYKSVNGQPLNKKNRDIIYWYGSMTFVNHFFKLLSCRYVEAEVKLHPELAREPSGDQSSVRKLISESARAAIYKDIKLVH